MDETEAGMQLLAVYRRCFLHALAKHRFTWKPYARQYVAMLERLQLTESVAGFWLELVKVLQFCVISPAGYVSAEQGRWHVGLNNL